MMQYQRDAHPRRAPHGAPPADLTPTMAAWQARAITAHIQHSSCAAASLCASLVAAIRTLTGRAPDPGTIVVDLEQQVALATLDGVRFHAGASGLTIVRPCAHCGLGAFVSPPITRLEDLGSALASWRPLHADCRPFEPDTVD